MTGPDPCGLSWLALLPLAAFWFAVTFTVVLTVLLLWR